MLKSFGAIVDDIVVIVVAINDRMKIMGCVHSANICSGTPVVEPM